ncbi:MAG: CBS domain-containing protein, partial [Candidatus Aenigmarchaeota archaeon]|nr:CBS domain-containing protein [Candidatus Aenigmarchaeota archaeon]
NNISSLLVKEKGEFIGIVSEKDIINKVVAEELYPGDVKVREIMNRPLVTIPEKETIEKAVELMKKKGIRRLAVTEGGRIVGLISETDITRQLKKL